MGGKRVCAFQSFWRLDMVICMLKSDGATIAEEKCYPKVCPFIHLLGNKKEDP